MNKTINFHKKLEKKIPKNYYLHISHRKINYKDIHFKKIKIKQIDSLKPNGLWLSGTISESDSWINWVIKQEKMNWYDKFDKFYYYAVNVDIKSPKLLILDTQTKLIEFHQKYMSLKNKYSIYWSKLYKEGYYGVYFKLLKDLVKRINTFTDNNNTIRKMIWYNSLDCTCFCIWNNKLILDIMEINI